MKIQKLKFKETHHKKNLKLADHILLLIQIEINSFININSKIHLKIITRLKIFLIFHQLFNPVQKFEVSKFQSCSKIHLLKIYKIQQIKLKFNNNNRNKFNLNNKHNKINNKNNLKHRIILRVFINYSKYSKIRTLQV